MQFILRCAQCHSIADDLPERYVKTIFDEVVLLCEGCYTGWRERKAAAALLNRKCTICTRIHTTPPGERAYKRCGPCREVQRVWSRKYRERPLGVGRCKTCRKRPVAPWKIRCQRCLEAGRLAALRWKRRTTAARRAAGVCVVCQRPSKRYQHCPICRKRQAVKRQSAPCSPSE